MQLFLFGFYGPSRLCLSFWEVSVRWCLAIKDIEDPEKLQSRMLDQELRYERKTKQNKKQKKKKKREKNPDHPQAELCFSHMWPELGSNSQRWEKGGKNDLLGKTLIWQQFPEFSTSGSLFWSGLKNEGVTKFYLKRPSYSPFKKDTFSESEAVCIWGFTLNREFYYF